VLDAVTGNQFGEHLGRLMAVVAGRRSKIGLL
jgi:hypothetical protein